MASSQTPRVDYSGSRRIALAYTTHMSLRTFSGISMPTGYEVMPAAELLSVSDFEGLKANGADEVWEESKLPKADASLMPSLTNWRFYIPRKDC